MIEKRYLGFIVILLLLSIACEGVISIKQGKIAKYRVNSEVGGINSRSGSSSTPTGNVDVPLSYVQKINAVQITCGLDGEMYIIDYNSIRIVETTDCNPQSTDIMKRYVSSYSATINYNNGDRLNVILAGPYSLAIHPITGDVYFPQNVVHVITKVMKSTGTVTKVFGTLQSAGSTLSTLNFPKHMVFDPTTMDMLVADSGNSRILRIFPNMTAALQAGTGTSTSENVDPKKAIITGLLSVISLSSGDVYYLETGKIRMISNSIVKTVVSNANLEGYLSLSTDEKRIFYHAKNQVFYFNISSQTSTLVAGAKTTGEYSGDGGLAVNSGLNAPKHTFMNKQGDLYISCADVIRKVFANGTIITFTGYPDTASYKFSGTGLSKEVVPVSGRPAIALNQTSGELYFFDEVRTLRKVSSDGYVRNVIGVMTGDGAYGTAPLVVNGMVGPNYKFNYNPSAIGILGNAIYLYVGATTGVISKLENYNYSTFVPASSLKVLSTSNCPTKPTFLIRYNETENSIYYVYDTRSIAKYNLITGKSEAIINVNGAGGIISTTTYRTAAILSEIRSATINRKGEIFINAAPSGYSYILKMEVNGNVSIISGSTTGDTSEVALSAGKYCNTITSMIYNEKTQELLIADSANFKVKKSSSGNVKLVAGGGLQTTTNVVATSAKLGTIFAMALTDNSEIIIYDSTTNPNIVLKVIYPNGTLSFLQTSISATTVNSLNAKTLDEIYIAVPYSILKLTNRATITIMAGTNVAPDGFEIGDPIKGEGGNPLKNRVNPKSIDVSSTGDIYFQESIPTIYYNLYTSIKKVSNGVISTLMGYDTGPLCTVDDIAQTVAFNSLSFSSNAIYTADNQRMNRITKISESRNVSTITGVGGTTYIGEGLARMVNVVPVATFYLESTGELYFAESNRIRKVNSSGISELVAGNGQTTYSVTSIGSKATTTSIGTVTAMVAYRTSVTYIYVLSSNRISVIYDGMIYLIGGSNFNFPLNWYSASYYYKGEGGDALGAYFDDSNQMVISSKGEIYIAEQGRIRKLSAFCDDMYFMDEDSLMCYWYCFGEKMNSTNACSSRGSCDSPDKCICDLGFGGDKCENIECLNGWYNSPYCNVTSCNNIMSDDPTVCTGFGNCTDYETCTCETGYSGSYCEEFTCNGIASTSIVACNLRGTCVDIDTCKCNDGYYGSDCELVSCYGIRQDNLSVCSGNGVCNGLDNCKCNNGYYGQTCNVTSCFGIYSTNTSVCNGNGKCISKDACACGKDFTGVICNITMCYGIPKNDPHVCTGNGECTLNHTCKCFDGYFSENCSISSCFGIRQDDTSVCSGKGNCISKDICQCNIGYYGTSCNETSCYGIRQDNSSVCSEHGLCASLDKCICNSGYFGDACNLISCYGTRQDNSSVCSGFGNCEDINKCNCQDGYYGETCNITSCFGIRQDNSSVCSGNGFCIGMDQCSCNNEYFGEICNVTSCFGIRQDNESVCSYQGICVDIDNCLCNNEYHGETCNITSCFGVRQDDANVCSANGACVSINRCNCKEGFYGEGCNITSCYGIRQDNSSVCSEHGLCASLDKCICNSGYFGDACNLISCFGIRQDNSSVCSGFGICEDINKCNCQEGYYGETCNITSCFGIRQDNPTVCSENGTCIGHNQCSCNHGYYGEICNISSCFGTRQDDSNVCSANGTCTELNQCKCNTGYYGRNCNVTSCFGVRQDDINVCTGNGTCNNLDICSCFFGHYGENCQFIHSHPLDQNSSISNSTKQNETIPIYCFGIASTNTSVCSGNGSCESTNFCKCYSIEFMDEQCKYLPNNTDLPNILNSTINNSTIFNNSSVINSTLVNSNTSNSIPISCFGKLANDTDVCNGRGSCLSLNNCTCFQYSNETLVSGDMCQYLYCLESLNSMALENSTRVCSSHGICSTLGCVCNESYIGKACQDYEFSCYGVKYYESSVCSGNGVCVSPNNCSCIYGFYGNKCENSPPGIVRCFGAQDSSPEVCSRHGICVANNNCSCFDGYTGESCSEPICYGIKSSSNLVCSGKGQCNEPNKCSCTNGYTGNNCSIPICFGILANNSRVCSNSGICKSPDSCTCNSGYSGTECEIPVCYGISANDPMVCNGNGKCSAPNVCDCKGTSNKVKIVGNQCQYIQCLGSDNIFLNSTDPRVCNEKGSCTMNGCQCRTGFVGEYCQLFTCGGVLFNNTNVCNGNGNCTDYNTCVCEQNSFDGYWQGSLCESCRNDYETELSGCKNPKCDSLTCNLHGTCNTNLECVCNRNWDGKFCSTCKSNYFGNDCDTFCSKTTTCSNHGECSINGTCSCYSTSQQGYFEGSNCNVCKKGFYGAMCSTQIIGPAKFLNMFNGIVLRINGPNTFTQSRVDCSRLISANDQPMFGSGPVCMWSNRTSGEFTILFGDDFTLTPGLTVKMNRLVFDSSGSDLQDVDILNADYPATPVVIFSGLNNIGSCDNFTLDASASYSGDRKPLKYYWSIVSSPNNFLSLNLTTGSMLLLDYLTLQNPGEYKFGLQVKSSISGVMSELRVWTVYKTDVPLPLLSVIGLSDRSILKNEAPVVIKKRVELPTCFFTNQELNIVWQQVSGPNAIFETDKFNNLAITHFSSLVEAVYEFKVSATSVVNSASTASDTIKITVLPSPLSLSMYSDEVSSENGIIVVNFMDPDTSAEDEIWSWSCLDSTNNLGCGNVIENALKIQGDERTSRIEISSQDLKSYNTMPTLQLTLSIVKGVRFVSKTLEFVFPEREKVPPTITLISVLPTKPLILRQDLVNVQLAVTANGESVGIDNYIIREWSLNSNILLLSDSVLSKMNEDPRLTNSIVINPETLEYGSTNILTLKVTDIRNGLTASYSHSFTMATPPQACPCTVLPSSGIALETSFSFTCINCQNAQKSLQVVYGFIDDKSGANIPLYQQGEIYSTKLPSSYTPLTNNIVTIYIRITDTLTGAFTEIRKDIIIELAPVKSVMDVKKKVASYSSIQNSLKDGDTTKMVFNSATISRVTNGMLTKLTTGAKRSLQVSPCKNGGTFNSELNRCECPEGFYKHDCSVSLEDFTAYKEIRLSLINEFIYTFEARNPYEIISETYFTLQAYGLDSLIEQYDEIDEHSIEKAYSVVTTLLKLCEINKELRVPYGADKLFTNILNSIYNYIRYNHSEDSYNRLIRLINMFKQFSNLMLRGLFIGEKDLKLKTNFSLLSTNKMFRAGYGSKRTSPHDGNSITLPPEMPFYLTEKSNRKPISFISLVITDIFENSVGSGQVYNSEIITVNTSTINTNVSTSSYVRSNILMFELVDSKTVDILNPIQYNLTVSSLMKNYPPDTLISSQTLNSNDQQVITKVYRSSELSCKTFNNGTIQFGPSSCTLQLTSNSTAICQCNSPTGALLVENIIEKQIVISTPTISRIPPTQVSSSIEQQTPSNTQTIEKTTIIGIIIGVLCVLICVIIAVAVCVILVVLIKKKRPKKQEIVEQEEVAEVLEMTYFSV